MSKSEKKRGFGYILRIVLGAALIAPLCGVGGLIASTVLCRFILIPLELAPEGDSWAFWYGWIFFSGYLPCVIIFKQWLDND